MGRPLEPDRRCPALKDRLLNYVVFSLPIAEPVRSRDAGSRAHHPLGPPGTGKTTLAMGLGPGRGGLPRQARPVRDVDPHAFPSQLLGEPQRASPDSSTGRSRISRSGESALVLLDEVESLAVSRSRASMDTNPVDVHRATDAVLAGVDDVAERCPNVIFVATTNFEAGLDAAFLSRADVVELVGLPSIDATMAIVADTIAEPWVGAEHSDPAEIRALATACVDPPASTPARPGSSRSGQSSATARSRSSHPPSRAAGTRPSAPSTSSRGREGAP